LPALSRCSAGWRSATRPPRATIPDDKALRLRIGVNLGDVIVEAADIYGDGVNVAARLEPLAEPGEICVSRVVRDEVNGKLQRNMLLSLGSLHPCFHAPICRISGRIPPKNGKPGFLIPLGIGKATAAGCTRRL